MVSYEIAFYAAFANHDPDCLHKKVKEIKLCISVQSKVTAHARAPMR